MYEMYQGQNGLEIYLVISWQICEIIQECVKM